MFAHTNASYHATSRDPKADILLKVGEGQLCREKEEIENGTCLQLSLALPAAVWSLWSMYWHICVPGHRLLLEPSKVSVYPAFISCFFKCVVAYQLEHILERGIPKFPITGLRRL